MRVTGASDWQFYIEFRKGLFKKVKFEKRISQGLRQPESKYKGFEVRRSLVCLKNSNKIQISDGSEEKQEMRLGKLGSAFTDLSISPFTQ